MGCIEILFNVRVHKHHGKFNRNMGCIEIPLQQFQAGYPPKFNRNMGCIEICITAFLFYLFVSLIETWDVLKCVDNPLSN